MSQNISVDAGHGYVKALSTTGERVLFPSLIAPAPTGPDLGRFGSQAVVVLDGEKYLVGDDARRSTGSLFSKEKATDPLTIAITKIAAAKAAGPGYHIVNLGVGLPLSWYASQKDALAAALTATATVDDCHLMIKSVSVFPQGIGALVSVGDLPWVGLVGLVDIGYRTVDFVVAEVRDGMPQPLTQYAGTYPGGMHIAFQSIAQALESETQVRFEPHELNADRETVTANGRQITLDPFRAFAFEALAGDLSRHLAITWDGVMDKLDRLYLAGGGAIALSPYLSGLSAVRILPDSQWANAQGFLSLLDG